MWISREAAVFDALYAGRNGLLHGFYMRRR
jgi:hypothetical protein